MWPFWEERIYVQVCLSFVYMYMFCFCRCRYRGDPICQFKGVGLSKPQLVPLFNNFLYLHHGKVMFKCIICQSFKKFHRAVFSIAHPKYSNFGWFYWRQMIILVSEDSNRYAHLFLIKREYFGFNTLESVVVE